MNTGALAVFAFVSSITPGPNNVMLWASGLNFGFRRTVRHLAGVNLGFVSLLMATALGLGVLFREVPWLSPTLRILGSVYLVYLAYRIATAGKTEGRTTSRPMSFFEAVAFQYVNPKAWVMGITAAGSFLPTDAGVGRSTAVFGLVFGLVNLPCIMAWAAAGSTMGRFLESKRARQVINVILAGLLLFTVYLINV
jgi:threonine/homoserine/homoserine lactone efflux protein